MGTMSPESSAAPMNSTGGTGSPPWGCQRSSASRSRTRCAAAFMYHAKDSGRANFQYFTQHMNVAAQQRLSLVNSLRRALENREFEVHYQPLFDLRDRSITGFEALLRWNRPGREMVSPGETRPWPGRFQRIRASTPVIDRSRRSCSGW